MKSQKKSRVFTTLILFIIITSLSAVMISTAFKSAEDNSIKHLQLMAEERSVMIEDYISSAEKVLNLYSNSSDITKVIKNPNNNSITQAAQEYTEEITNDTPELEDIYAALWTTKILVHSNPNNVGIPKRKRESLNSLYYCLQQSGNSIYNSGIIESEDTGRQVVSMFKSIRDEKGATIGITGLEIETQPLKNSLNNLNLSGMENAVYSMISVKDCYYLFNNDSSLIYTPCEIEQIREISDECKSSDKNKSGYLEHTENGVKYISAYIYMAEPKWLLMIDTPKVDVLSFAFKMSLFLIGFWLFTLLIIMLFNSISKKQEITNKKLFSSIQKNEDTQRNLSKAVMEDILTDTYTRNKFIKDFANTEATQDKPYYFIMINIPHFSDINIRYGNDIGDQILVNAANALKKEFGNDNTYRTGSDEFVAAVRSSSTENINAAANKVVIDLCRTFEINDKSVPINCIAAVVKKSRNINSSVLLQLKNMLKSSQGAPLTYMDADMI